MLGVQGSERACSAAYAVCSVAAVCAPSSSAASAPAPPASSSGAVHSGVGSLISRLLADSAGGLTAPGERRGKKKRPGMSVNS